MTADRAAAQKAVEELVGHYQAKARSVGRLGVAIGASAGVLIGAVPLSPLRFAWPIPSGYGFATILGGLVVGVLIGYVIGDGRAQMYQRMAEQARLQLQLEQRISENDARMAQLLTALTARATAAARSQVPQQVHASAPVQAPPPVQATAPVLAPQVVPALPPVQVPQVVHGAPAQAQPLQPAAFAEPQQSQQPQQPYLTQVPAAAPGPNATPNNQATPAAPPLSPPVSR